MLDDLAAGTLTWPQVTDIASLPTSELSVRANPERAAYLRSTGPADLTAIWPRLSLISCWMDGPSSAYATRLHAQFPQTPMQGKGLLATECFATFPLVNQPGAALSVRSHFFEFIEHVESTDGSATDLPTVLAHQLEQGKTYSLVVTTGGGLYRYRMHDLVEVLGHLHQLPLLRFVGKSNRTADYFGEKLSESFVAAVLAQLCRTIGLNPPFAMLVPYRMSGGFHYDKTRKAPCL